MARLNFAVEAVSRQEWEEVLRSSPCATFFHSPTWIDAMCRAVPEYANETRIARSSDGRRVILPMVRTWQSTRSGLAGLESSPPHCYGGPIFDCPPDPEFVASATLAIIESPLVRAHSAILHGNPHLGLELSGLEPAGASETHVISLSGGYSQVRARYKSGHKSTLSKKKLSAIAIRCGESTGDWQGYFALYQKSLQRWGDAATSNHRWSIFAQLREAAPGVRLWLAQSDGVVCSGAIVLYQFPRAYYWHAAYDSDYANLSANNILQDAVIQDACAQGYEAYDLLASGSHKGVASFKDSLGAKRIPMVAYEWKAPWITRVAGATRNYLGLAGSRVE